MNPLIERLVPGSIGILLSGGAGLYFFREIAKAVLSRRWSVVRGEIVRSQLSETRRKDGVLSSAWIEYRYEVGDRAYRGDRVCFGDRLTANAGVTRERLRKFPVGREVAVRVNPKDPQDATILPVASFMVWFYMVLGFGVAASIGLAIINGE